MWILRTFRTKENMQKFIKKNSHRIQYNEVFINNCYAIEYRKLRKI
jgi:hypothetical protein